MRVGRPRHPRQLQPNFRWGRYRGGARSSAQPVLGDDSSQKRHYNHLRLQKPQTGGIQRHRATTERERRPLLVRDGLQGGLIWRQGKSNKRSRQC